MIVGLLGGQSPTDLSIRRIFCLHYLLAIFVSACVMCHIVFVHRSRPSSIPVYSDGSFGLLDVIIKDAPVLVLVVHLYSLPLSSRLIHSDNWQFLNLLQTPPHIEPEAYFLWLFAILKSRSKKSVGICLFVFGM